ncbi:MAG TPA: hypothetical protein VGD58_15820 [Herpetosiphonaceae bacterium]
MNEQLGSYHVVDLPSARRVVLDFLDLPAGKHYIYGLLEVDVTVAWNFIEEYLARMGERLSFTGYLTFCLARAVAEDTSVQAYRKGHTQLVVCDDVDVGLMMAPIRALSTAMTLSPSAHPRLRNLLSWLDVQLIWCREHVMLDHTSRFKEMT